jgi:hypothetical protein
VRSAYRLAVAHGNLDEYFKLVLDPANVSIDHRIDFTNAVLMSVVAEMIQDERDLMTRHGLRETVEIISRLISVAIVTRIRKLFPHIT